MALRSLVNIYRIQNARMLCASSAFPHFRCTYTDSAKSTQTTHRKSLYKTKEVKKIRFFVLRQYFEYLKNYDAVLEKRFPDAMRVYRVFVDGIRDFFADLRTYIRIVRSLNKPGYNLKSLTLSELEVYYQMPKDMRRVAPVLLISALPFANYVIFPIAYYFPRHLLCRHFWNLQQKAEFNYIFLHKRLVHNKPVFRYLQLQLPQLRGKPLHKKWSNILGLLGSGVQPTVEEILECKDLFVDGPYHLMYLSGNHIRHLMKMYELHSGWFRRSRLGDTAKIIQAMDLVIEREGGPQSLPIDILRHACIIRGLSPMNMRTEDMVTWITQWIKVSREVDKQSWSLLLHCSVLLGYNQPSNWQLIYSYKNK